MQSIRTIVAASFVVLALCFATVPSMAANRVVNGDFETCDLTGWSRAQWEDGRQSNVYSVFAIDGSCSYITLDQAVIQQTFEIATGEQFVVSFLAELLPVVPELTASELFNRECMEADPTPPRDTISGRVVLEFLQALPGQLPSRTVGAEIIEVTDGGAYSLTADPAPLTATHARVKVAGCAAFGGVVYDNIVVEAVPAPTP